MYVQIKGKWPDHFWVHPSKLIFGYQMMKAPIFLTIQETLYYLSEGADDCNSDQSPRTKQLYWNLTEYHRNEYNQWSVHFFIILQGVGDS